ncbi:alpha/beta fold hydrolase [Costertonia aggregata]|uniref:Alpha/beta hydrolase n=1 Tax=Costertonia aggregata TaxID=343403 RepID=A0A7H9ANL5_9FLAO|nr:alpha/beta hydrolase [Costertonia aggregata]QLG45042.1 alpha/beta hydrolase [Costertonia aggregata]
MGRFLKWQFLIVILLLVFGCKEQSNSKVQTKEIERPKAPRELTVNSSVGGIDIHYTVYGSGNHTLLFVHGWSCDQTYWSEQVDYFKKYHTVVTVDLGGHGKSGTQREDWSIPAFGSDVMDVIQKLDFEELSIIGHSMGVAVAIDAAARTEVPIHTLVGVDYLKAEMKPALEEAIDKRIAPFYANFEGLTRGFVKSMFLPASDSVLVKKIVDDMASTPPEVAVPAMKGLAMKDLNPDFTVLSNKKIERHLINSDRRPITDSYLDSLGFKTHVFEGSGHFLMIEKAGEFNELLSGILVKK